MNAPRNGNCIVAIERKYWDYDLAENNGEELKMPLQAVDSNFMMLEKKIEKAQLHRFAPSQQESSFEEESVIRDTL